jgi:hypothetical protein
MLFTSQTLSNYVLNLAGVLVGRIHLEQPRGRSRAAKLSTRS